MLRCTHCGAVQVRLAHFRWSDLFLLPFLLRRCKCTSCRRSFYTYVWQKPEKI